MRLATTRALERRRVYVKSSLALFPGQGSQFVGMGKDLLQEFPYTRALFEEAEDKIHLSLRKLCFDGPAEELGLTANLQPALLTVSMATWQVLTNESDYNPCLFAGHSLGEYSALVASRKLPFAQAVHLVHLRGQAMQNAVPAGLGKMAAVLRYNPEALIAECLAQTKLGLGVVEVVNFNSPEQHIISGHKDAVEALCKTLKEKRVLSKMLPVSAPFHSSLMSPAKEFMKQHLSSVHLKDSDKDVIANLTGDVPKPYTLLHLLEQIDHPVFWEQSMCFALKERHIEHCLEIGPGKVLMGIGQKCFGDAVVCENTMDLKSIL